MQFSTVMIALITLQDIGYILAFRAAKKVKLGPNARQFMKLIGINMLIYCITAIGFSVFLITSIVAAIASWNLGENTFFPSNCKEWETLINTNINWPLYRSAFAAITISFSLQFLRAVLDPLVHIIGSNAIRKSVTFGLF